MKTVVMAALQRVRGVVACRGGRGRRDGARKHSEGSRGRRWPRRYGGAAAAALGRVRERKQRRETRERERARGSRGVRGILRATGRQAERQEVAWACARALRPRACAYWREEEDDKGEEVGWAGQVGELGRLGWTGKRQVSLLLCFIFSLFCFVLFNLFCHCFEFKIIQTMPKTPLNILYC